jgi:endonuclease III
MSSVREEAGRIRMVYARIEAAARDWEPTVLSYFEGQPFKALVAAMLSAQTREEHTMAAMQNLLRLGETPFELLRCSDEQLREAIRPVMYYESKLGYLRDICQKLVERGGAVPSSLEELMTFKGVGWKVAVLTRAAGFGIHEDITVDVHVARISKRLGWVDPAITAPPKINEALKAVMPRDLWPGWNSLMVQFGRAICKPTAPQCRRCPVADLCPKVGVGS